MSDVVLQNAGVHADEVVLDATAMEALRMPAVRADKPPVLLRADVGITVGRIPAFLIESPLVSRAHCVLRWDGGASVHVHARKAVHLHRSGQWKSNGGMRLNVVRAGQQDVVRPSIGAGPADGLVLRTERPGSCLIASVCRLVSKGIATRP